MEKVAGVMTIGMACTSKVWPSGADLITASVAMMPLAPGRFSTTTACFSDSLSLGASTRASESPPPPAANGTNILMVCVG